MFENLIGRGKSYEDPDSVQLANTREALLQISTDFIRVRMPWMERLKQYRGLLVKLGERGSLSAREMPKLLELDQRLSATFGDQAPKVISSWNRAVDPGSIENPQSIFSSVPR